MLSEDQQNRKVAEFVEVTQSSPDEAHECLDACNWDLQDALAFYFNSNAEEVREATPSHAPVPPAPASASARPRPPRGGTPKRFATLSDLANRQSDDSAYGSEAEDDRDRLFTGGEKSGLAVQNPDNAGGSGSGSGRLIDEILRKASMGRGGSSATSEDEDEAEQRRNVPRFRGAGYTLGSDETPSTRIEDEHAQEEDEPTVVSRQLIFWKEGFSVEDGPLYRYDDPNNMQLLNAVNSGSAPLSLLNVRPGQRVDVRILRRMEDNYEPPKRAQGGFSGQGNRLGSTIPNEPVQRAEQPSSRPQAPAQSSERPQMLGEGDITVMFQLLDGRRVKHKFRGDQTVGDIYNTVTDLSGLAAGTFLLQTTFPIKELSEMDQTVDDAKVKGSVLTQKKRQ
ncbi:UBX domain-containing protein 1 [Trichomonascus vanleenenianus]|uniref:protein phosphatase regulator SHP1 n=1 Tax=Trichomonascus vanleenenianus TaxID=2268995 RepID=UPI003EC994D1